MAIDFMVMPLSRYVAGDFVTPAMQFCWDQEVPYRIMGPDGVRELPPNVPFGGMDAAAKRERFVPMILEDLRRAFTNDVQWDERSSSVPRFHRVDPSSFQALLAHTEKRAKPSLLGKSMKRDPADRDRRAHLLGTLFVPGELAQVVEIESPLKAIMASVSIALAELSQPVPADAEPARETLRAALQDASELCLPMIVDA